MNRRGFLGLLGKLVAVGAAMGVPAEILKPVEGRLIYTGSNPGTIELFKKLGYPCEPPTWTLAS